MELKLVRAYIAALFELAKHARTFSVDANALIRDLSEPGVSPVELFENIEKAPCNSFESHLKASAHRIAAKPAQQ